MKNLIVVSDVRDWKFKPVQAHVITAKQYLKDIKKEYSGDSKVINLCRSYKYQSIGYYVSLLAEARSQKVFPRVSHIQDMKSSSLSRSISEDLDALIQKQFQGIKSDKFVLSIYFGRNVAKKYDRLSRLLYGLFQFPNFQVIFEYLPQKEKWRIQRVFPMMLDDIPESHYDYFGQFASDFLSKKRNPTSSKSHYLYDMAILLNKKDISCPSDEKAIQCFQNAAEKLKIYTEIVDKDCYNHINEYDALFIRETTQVQHHTYRISRKAHSEGLVVIDDPVSILRCTNKVFLAELLAKEKIGIPQTHILQSYKDVSLIENVKYPLVLKTPDGSFSRGVIKVEDPEECKTQLNIMLQSSELILAQEFIPTPFDWRIGILDKKVIYASKYFMAKDHWQIYQWAGETDVGEFETVAVSSVPDFVLKTALKSANLIGDGLYGVDLKELNGKAIIIEINDNPSIDFGIEDQVLGMELYHTIMQSFFDRMEKNKHRQRLVL